MEVANLKGYGILKCEICIKILQVREVPAENKTFHLSKFISELFHALQLGEPVHEIGHTLGLIHEHNRPDRDSHVTIHTDHVIPGYRFLLGSWWSGNVKDNGEPYDYASIMHYPAKVSTAIYYLNALYYSTLNHQCIIFNMYKNMPTTDLQNQAYNQRYDR